MIVIIPMGPVPLDLLTWLADRLQSVVKLPVQIGTARSLPPAGYDTERKQYRADEIMNTLRRIAHPGAERLVAIIDRDCFAPGLNFIFGQAVMNGREAFVALPRLRPEFYGLPENRGVFRERVFKEVVHELGHTWGLGHCSDPGCVMHFSNTLADTNRKGTEFCRYCRGRMNEPSVEPE